MAVRSPNNVPLSHPLSHGVPRCYQSPRQPCSPLLSYHALGFRLHYPSHGPPVTSSVSSPTSGCRKNGRPEIIMQKHKRAPQTKKLLSFPTAHGPLAMTQ